MKGERSKVRRPIGAVHTLLLCLFFLFSTSCVDEPAPAGNARVAVTFKLGATSAMGGMLTIHEGYLKLDQLALTGSSGAENTTNITHAVPPEEPPYRLSDADSAHLHLNLPFYQYSQLDLVLHLYQDNYELKVPEDPIVETPPVENDGDVPNPPGEDTGDDDDNGETGGDDDGDDDGEGSDSGDDGEKDDKEDKGEGKGDDHDGDNDHDGDDSGKGEDDDKDDDDKDDGDKDDDDGEGSGKGDKGDKGEKGDKGKGKDDKDEDDDDDDNDDDDDKDDDDDDDDDDKDEDDGRVEGHTVDLDDFFQNARPSIVVFGTYQNNGQTIDVILVVTDVEQIVLHGQQNGGSAIALSENNSAVISFNPEHWFGLVEASDIESGSLQTYQGRRVLFVHKAFNQALYEKLIPRLAESVSINIASDL